MLEQLVRGSVKHRTIVVAAVLLSLAALGGTALDLSLDAVPDITNVQVQVFTRTPSMGASDVERYVTYPVELALTGLPGVKELRSVSRFGISVVTLVFEEGTDLYWARQVVSERLSEARESIPEGFGSPELLSPSTGLGEVYMFTLSSPDRSVPLHALRELLDWELVPRLRAVPGVVEVSAEGGYVRRFEVLLDPRRLVSYGIGVGDVLEAVEHNNAVAGGGYIERAGEAYLISGSGLVETLDELKDVVVTTRGAVPITVGHLGTVRFGAATRVGAATADGEGETVIGTVNMLVGANARAVASAVDAEVAEIRASLPADVELRTFYNRSDLVERVLATVGLNLAEGGALVIIVLLLMLGNFRAGLLVAAIIPLSMTIAAAAMTRLGISGNLMSLGAIDFGLVVDGSVVMVEHMLLRASTANLGQGGVVRVLDQRDLARVFGEAAAEVARPVAFGVGIICVVYLPILTLTGVEGKMFQPMAVTVLFALVGSLVLSLTFTPAATALVLRRGATSKQTWLHRGAMRLYRPVLERAMAYPRRTVAVALVVVIAGVAGASTLGTEFMPRLDEGDLVVQLTRLPSVSLEESLRTTTEAERIIGAFPEVKRVVSRTGTAEGSSDIMGMELSDVFVLLHPRSEWPVRRSKASLVADLSAALRDALPGVGLTFTQPIEMRFNELLAGVRSDVAVKIFGEDLDAMRASSLEIARVLARVEGATDVRVESPVDANSVDVTVDRARLARYGTTAADVLAAVESAGSGRVVGSVLEGRRRFDLAVLLATGASRLSLEGLPVGAPAAGPASSPSIMPLGSERPRSAREELARIPVATSSGALVPVGELAEVAIRFGPAQVSHEAASRRIVVECNVRGRDLGGFVAEARAAIRDAVKLPGGYFMRWGGQFENLARARGRLLVAVPVALGLIFILLFVLFDRARPALLVFLNVPIAATGGVFALMARGMPFSISAGVGFIALFGVAVLNGVVLITHVQRLRIGGLAPSRAAFDGALSRLRPVLMTALVASLGFVPMAIATTAGAEVQRPLATVVIGGLVTSTLLTLLLLPTSYAWTVGRRRDDFSSGGDPTATDAVIASEP